MTFILNVLHKDMSILAADKKVVAEWPSAWSFPSRGKAVANDYKKITMNSHDLMALGMSGYSPHHSYIEQFERRETIGDGLSIIRHHMERFLLVDDREELIKAASPFENECIASFYDADTKTLFTNEFGFNQFSNRTRLHRAADGVKVFCAGSGRDHFDVASGKLQVQSLVEGSNEVQLPDAIIPWMREVFGRVSAKDEGCGAEAMFVVSTRESPKFCFV